VQSRSEVNNASCAPAPQELAISNVTPSAPAQKVFTIASPHRGALNALRREKLGCPAAWTPARLQRNQADNRFAQGIAGLWQRLQLV
jgi:hypothetical protein